MLKNTPLLTAAALSLCAALAFAQEAPSVEKTAATEKKTDAIQLAANTGGEKSTPSPKPKPTPKADATASTEAPIPEIISTPKPKKPGFFQRIFGSRKPKPEATASPAPESTPTPTPRKSTRKAAATPTPEDSQSASASKPDKASKATTPKPDMPVVASSTPAKTTVKATPKPKTAVAKNKDGAPEPPADADPEVKEKFRFEQAKAKASEDPQVKSLKEKADNAATDEESRKALRAYNKALFDKIRKVDSSVSQRATRLEAAILKRLSE